MSDKGGNASGAKMIWAARIAGGGVLAGIAFVAALLFAAARSDFVMRGCPEIPQAEWPSTANCSDGWFAQIAAPVVGAVCLLFAGLVLWGLRR